MSISTRDMTAGGLSSDRSSLTENHARSESKPDRPTQDAGTDLDREAERFSALLQAKPDSKAMDDGTSERGEHRIKQSSHSAGSHAAQQDDWVKTRDAAARTSVPESNDRDTPAARQSEPALEGDSAHPPNPPVDRPNSHATVMGASTHAHTDNEPTPATHAQSPRVTADAQPARASTATATTIGDNRHEPQRSTNAQIIQDTAANVSATKRASQSTGASSSKDTEPSPSSNAFPSGDRILLGLGQHGATVENTPISATSATQTSDRIEQIERLGERLAQRILVSDRSHIGDSEVRIQLRESVLQGGEIRLRQEQGQLVVSIQVPSADLARQLSGQTDALQQTLANRLETSVRVEVQVVGARDAGNDAGTGDGRSRNRRDPWDTYDDQGA